MATRCAKASICFFPSQKTHRPDFGSFQLAFGRWISLDSKANYSAGFNLGLLMRHLPGYGTPKERASARYLFVLLLTDGDVLLLGVGLAVCGEISARDFPFRN
ncbi:MAG: hypothetical protein HQL98_00875 [Magnetococcales bacterium]|nr:hypothetical protein [Magnetococcales bacterium]